MKKQIQPYIAISNQTQIYCYGRILKAKKFLNSKGLFWLTNFINTFKRLESDEIPFQKFLVRINTFEKEYQANSEGFYKINEPIDIRNEEKLHLHLVDDIQINATHTINIPHPNHEFAVVSDIDDTILKTDVLSKLKLVYNSIFLNAQQRKIIPDSNLWYQKLHKDINPFFYISNSPWNFFDSLLEFITINNFPKGEIFLRDFGTKKKDSLQDLHNHKYNEVKNLITLFPNTKFILIGDGGEKDAFIYLQLKKNFPQNIKAIFIHRLGSITHQAKIETLLNEHAAYFYFIKNTEEGVEICKELGLI